jgi:hypothetical protein
VTAKAAKVGEPVVDFPVYVNLANLPATLLKV